MAFVYPNTAKDFEANTVRGVVLYRNDDNILCHDPDGNKPVSKDELASAFMMGRLVVSPTVDAKFFTPNWIRFKDDYAFVCGSIDSDTWVCGSEFYVPQES